MTVRDEKRRLRARMRQVRAAIGAVERARRAAIVEERLFSLIEMDAAATVLLFYSFGSEIETRRMAQRAHRQGKRLLLPFLDASAMEAAEVCPDDPLVPTVYGPKEPARRVAVDPVTVDVVVAPGLAFDRRGHRLGYGGGHYDGFLARLGPGALRLGIGFAEQLLDRIPVGPDDQPLDVVVTDAETVDCRAGP